jgi:hypothetical protein
MTIRRVFMLIQRGMTDRTLVCVWPWEKPVLEEIHGSNAVEVSIDEMCELKGAVSVKEVKLKHPKAVKGMTLREQFEAMSRVDPERSPLNEPELEFNRLMGRYGMHSEVKLPNVTKVFGNFGNFRAALRDYSKGKVPAFLDTSSPIEDEEKPLAEMTDAEVRKALKERGATVPRGASREELDELFLEAAPA